MRRGATRPFQPALATGWGGFQSLTLVIVALTTILVLAAVLAIGIVVAHNMISTNENTNYLKTGNVWGTELIQLAQVSAGNVENFHSIFKLGRTTTAGVAVSTVWAAGGLYPFLQSAETLRINSTSALDAPGGSGGHTMLVSGIDENFKYAHEEVTLDGTNVVTTTTMFFRVYRMRLKSAGSSHTNAGNIMAWSSSTAQVQAVVATGVSTTQLGIFSTAIDHDGWLESFSISVESGVFGSVQHIEVILHHNGVDAFLGDWGLQGGLGTSAFHEPLETPIYLPPNSTIEYRATSTSASTTVSVVFGIIVQSLPGHTTHP